MADTLFADVSYYQRPVDDSYPFRFITFRANDGTFPDPNFDLNLKWACSAIRRKRLIGFGVYFVLEENADASVATFLKVVGGKRKWWRRDKFNKMAVVIDEESWGGKMGGDHSAQVRHARERIIRELNNRRLPGRRKRHYEQDRKRVVVYGNVNNLTNMAPHIGDSKVFVAAYGSNPDYPGKIAHQFADNYNTPPFGPCDINSADGYSPHQFAVALGLRAPKKVEQKQKKPKRHKPKHCHPGRPGTKPLP